MRGHEKKDNFTDNSVLLLAVFQQTFQMQADALSEAVDVVSAPPDCSPPCRRNACVGASNSSCPVLRHVDRLAPLVAESTVSVGNREQGRPLTGCTADG